YVLAVRQNHPAGTRYGWREGLKTAIDASIGLFTMVIIVGGIVAGIFTATESAAVAVVYALLVTVFVYKTMHRAAILRVLRESLGSLAMVTAIIMTSSAFGFLLSYLKVPALLAEAIFMVSREPWVVLLAINALL